VGSPPAADTDAEKKPDTVRVEIAEPSKKITIHVGDVLSFAPFGFVQLRTTYNWRERPADNDRASTTAFSVPRARFGVRTGITRYFGFMVRSGVTADGGLRMERVYGDFDLSVVRFRAGRLKLPLLEEQRRSADTLQPVDFSATANAFDQGASQGLLLTYRPDKTRVRVHLGVTDGLRTGYAEFLDPLVADVAVTGRVEGLILGKDWSAFSDLVAFRGSPLALKVGAAGHYQSGGRTGRSIDHQLAYGTADVHFEANGFGAGVGGVIVDTVWEDGVHRQSGGVSAQMGGFVSLRNELWTRFDAAFSDGQTRIEPGQVPGEGDFKTVAAGWNLYFEPRTHRLKLQLDGQYMFDAQSPSLVPVYKNLGILPTDRGDQVTARLQIVAGF
jgi:hypothetical protein